MSRHPRCRIKAYSGALSVKCSSKAWQSFEEHHGRGLLIDGPVPTFRLGHGLAQARGDRNGQPHNRNPRRNNRRPGKTAGWFTKYREQYKECTELKLRIIMERSLFSEETVKVSLLKAQRYPTRKNSCFARLASSKRWGKGFCPLRGPHAFFGVAGVG